MKDKMQTLSILFLLVVSFSFSMTMVKGDIGGEDKNISEAIDLTFQYDSDPAEIIEETPEAPDVGDIVDEITGYANPEDTVYTGDDIIPVELLPGMEWVQLEINITAIYIWDDHDSTSAGEIFIRSIPNYWIGEPEFGWYNYEGTYIDTEKFPINDADEAWYNFTEPITLFNDWTVLSCM